MLKTLARAACSKFHQGRQSTRESIIFAGSPINPLLIFGNHRFQKLFKQRHSCACIGLEILMKSLINL
ncbi:hypothetical protein MXB_1105 [Myxobolus squamalis]|nr:hypothetical protein MXB_1105 [Myxobolus squamalis]